MCTHMQAYLKNNEETLNRAQSSLPLVRRRRILMGADHLAAGYCGTAMQLLPEFKFLSNFPHIFSIFQMLVRIRRQGFFCQ